MSKVWFFDYSQNKNALDGVSALMARSGFEALIPRGGSVAVKLHMGEMGNTRYVRPAFVRRVVDVIKSSGGQPFLFDTVAAYPGDRETSQKYLNTARRNGFSRATMSATVVVTEDTDPLQVIPVTRRVAGCELRQVKSPAKLLGSDCMLVLSHVKGHELAGFGGALKNLGMGCVSTETKRAQHLVNLPQLNEAACTGCGDCIEQCPRHALELVDDKPKRDLDRCTSCGTCLFECSSGAWVWPPGSKEKLQVCLAHAAAAVMSQCQGRPGFINFIQDVVPYCDCAAESGRPVVQDVGIVFSFDPVAVDKASLDLVDRAPVIPGSTTEVAPDILGKMHHTSSLVQLATAEKLGIGSLSYELLPVK